MGRLILFSVGSSQTKVNFNKSVMKGFDIAEVYQFFDISIINKNDLQQGKLYFWGCKSTKYYERKIHKVEQGDIIAFSMNKEFVIKGRIVGLTESRDLSKFLWDDAQFSYILIISDIENILIPYSVLFNDIGYSPKAKINGLVLVDTKKLERIAQQYRNVEVYLHEYVV